MHKPIRVVDENGAGGSVVNSPDEAILNDKIRLISRVIIVNNQKQVLLQKRASTMRSFPGCWDLSGGHVDKDETPHQAALRELIEETSIVTVLEEVCQYYSETIINHKSKKYIAKMYNHVFLGVFNGDIKKLQLQKSEVDEVKWFELNQIIAIVRDKRIHVTDGVINIFMNNESTKELLH